MLDLRCTIFQSRKLCAFLGLADAFKLSKELPGRQGGGEERRELTHRTSASLR